jgi:hypothetical protein
VLYDEFVNSSTKRFAHRDTQTLTPGRNPIPRWGWVKRPCLYLG